MKKNTIYTYEDTGSVSMCAFFSKTMAKKANYIGLLGDTWECSILLKCKNGTVPLDAGLALDDEAAIDWLLS